MDALSLIVTAIIAGGSAYFGAYLKKKGENFATHEDIDKLVSQVAVVTQTTKEIEAKISSEVWDAQRRWELKKDTSIELVKQVGDLKVTFITLSAAHNLWAKNENSDSAATKVLEAIGAFQKAHAEFQRVMNVTDLVLGNEVANECHRLNSVVEKIVNNIVTIKDVSIESSLYAEFTSCTGAVLLQMRKELKLI